MKPVVYMHSSENMAEVEDASASLFIAASVFLGKGVVWTDYRMLYDQVYNVNGGRVLKPNGLLLAIQTNAYVDGQVYNRYCRLLSLLKEWKLIDEKVWRRRKADHFQPPFSHVFVLSKAGSRKQITDKRYFQGLWDYPQTKGSDKAGYPRELCVMIIESMTKPGDLIVDPFAGTGMLLGVAASLGRRAVGYEIDESLIPTLIVNGCEVRE